MIDIELTDAAQARIKEILSGEGKNGLRLAVRAAGCSGLEYVMTTELAPDSTDLVKVYDGFELYVDRDSYEQALTGLQLDFQKDVLSSAFVYNNPNLKGSCGCGKSFSVS